LVFVSLSISLFLLEYVWHTCIFLGLITPDLTQEEKNELHLEWLIGELGGNRIKDTLRKKGIIPDDL